MPTPEGLGFERSDPRAVVVEHADPVWQGSAERVKAGLVLARRLLVHWLP